MKRLGAFQIPATKQVALTELGLYDLFFSTNLPTRQAGYSAGVFSPVWDDLLVA